METSLNDRYVTSSSSSQVEFQKSEQRKSDEIQKTELKRTIDTNVRIEHEKIKALENESFKIESNYKSGDLLDAWA